MCEGGCDVGFGIYEGLFSSIGDWMLFAMLSGVRLLGGHWGVDWG